MSDWNEVLSPTPDCIDLARIGGALDATERIHLETCARCQAELALFREIDREATSPEEERDVQWIANELKRRNKVVVPFPTNRWRALYSIAAALVVVIGIGWWTQMREPSIDVPQDQTIYRSVRLDIIAPAGDLAQAPNELRWNAVPNASRYHVQILEVDATQVWSADTVQPRIALPQEIIAQFAPGKSLLWEVKAFRGQEMLATSETQTVRVSVRPRKDS